MKTRFITLLTFLLSISVFAGAFIDFFHAKSEDGKVKLEWKTAEESNVQKFVIERKPVRGDFVPIGEIQPKGNHSFYTYYDENAFKTSDVVYIYRLKIVDNDGSSSYSKERTVTHSISGVKRTWGSIKAMFR
jgi:hypothetical protein